MIREGIFPLYSKSVSSVSSAVKNLLDHLGNGSAVRGGNGYLLQLPKRKRFARFRGRRQATFPHAVNAQSHPLADDAVGQFHRRSARRFVIQRRQTP
jgi:hypothetical protein